MTKRTVKPVWRTKNRTIPIDDMDVDFKLKAAAHCIKMMNEFHDKLHFWAVKLEQLESSLHCENKIEVPETIAEIRDLQDLLKDNENKAKDIADKSKVKSVSESEHK